MKRGNISQLTSSWEVPGNQVEELTGRSTKPGWGVTLVDWVPRVTKQINRTDIMNQITGGNPIMEHSHGWAL